MQTIEVLRAPVALSAGLAGFLLWLAVLPGCATDTQRMYPGAARSDTEVARIEDYTAPGHGGRAATRFYVAAIDGMTVGHQGAEVLPGDHKFVIGCVYYRRYSDHTITVNATLEAGHVYRPNGKIWTIDNTQTILAKAWIEEVPVVKKP